MDCKRLEVKLLKNDTYSAEEQKKDEYRIEYCIRYKPVWATEWILLRWWWNDKWVWTADWIFNDWIV